MYTFETQNSSAQKSLVTFSRSGLVLMMSLSALSLTGCSNPGPCRGLMIGDDLIMTISRFGDSSDQPCNREELGLMIGTELRMKVEEQRASSGGDVSCLSSTGGLTAETGWSYQRSSKRPPVAYTFETEIDASKGMCAGEISIDVILFGEGDVGPEPMSASVVFEYSTRNSAASCPLSCRESLIGTLVRGKRP